MRTVYIIGVRWTQAPDAAASTMGDEDGTRITEILSYHIFDRILSSVLRCKTLRCPSGAPGSGCGGVRCVLWVTTLLPSFRRQA